MAVTDQVRRIKGAKASLKESIERKGVIVGDGTIDTYAAKVDAIPTGITPTGTITITQNGLHDVTNYANADVDVPGIVPTGTYTITNNGVYTIRDYEYVDVDVQGGSGNYNAYRAIDYASMINLGTDIPADELCILYDYDYVNLTEYVARNVGVTKIKIPTSITLPEPIPFGGSFSYIDVYFRDENWNTPFEVLIEGPGLATYVRLLGTETYYSYTTTDCQTYTADNFSDPVEIEFQAPATLDGYYDWNDAIGYFVQTEGPIFGGIWKSELDQNDETIWNMLPLGLNATSSEVLLGQKFYNDNGVQTGALDLNKFIFRNFIVSETEPTRDSLYPYDVWIKPISGSSYNNYYTSENENFLISNSELDTARISTTRYTMSGSNNRAMYSDEYALYSYNQNTLVKINLKTKEKETISYHRIEHTSNYVVANGKFYCWPYSGGSTPVSSLSVFDPTNNTWATTSSISSTYASSYNPVLFYHRGTNSIIVNVAGEDHIKIYSITNNSWTTKLKSSFTQEESDFRFETYSNYSSKPVVTNSGTVYIVYNDEITPNVSLYLETSSYFKEAKVHDDLLGSWHYIGQYSGKSVFITNYDEVVSCNIEYDTSEYYLKNIEKHPSINATFIKGPSITNDVITFAADDLNWSSNGIFDIYNVYNCLGKRGQNAPLLIELEASNDVDSTYNPGAFTLYWMCLNNKLAGYSLQMDQRIKNVYIYNAFAPSTSALYKDYNIVDQVYLYNQSNNTWESILSYNTTYAVYFDSDGGTSVQSQSVRKGHIVSNPVPPTKTNCAFLGWYLNGTPYDFGTPVEGSFTLTAVWQVVSHTVNFNSNGGSPSYSSQTVADGGTATNPGSPTKSHYTFSGWTLNGTAYNFSTPVTSDITLVASWTPVNYTVSFDSNGGSSVASQTVAYGNTATQPANPTRTNYTFNYWKLNGSQYNFSTPVTSNITLVADWTYVPQPHTPTDSKDFSVHEFSPNDMRCSVATETRINNGVHQIHATSAKIYINSLAYYGYSINLTLTINGTTLASISKSASETAAAGYGWSFDLSRSGWINSGANGSQKTVTMSWSWSSSNGYSHTGSQNVNCSYYE